MYLLLSITTSLFYITPIKEKFRTHHIYACYVNLISGYRTETLLFKSQSNDFHEHFFHISKVILAFDGKMMSFQEKNGLSLGACKLLSICLSLWRPLIYLNREKLCQIILQHWSLNETSSVVQIQDKCLLIRLTLYKIENMRRKYSFMTKLS